MLPNKTQIFRGLGIFGESRGSEGFLSADLSGSTGAEAWDQSFEQECAKITTSRLQKGKKMASGGIDQRVSAHINGVQKTQSFFLFQSEFSLLPSSAPCFFQFFKVCFFYEHPLVDDYIPQKQFQDLHFTKLKTVV